MVLLLHILIASSSIFYTAFLLLKPSRKGLNASYALVTLTVLSGIMLMVVSPAHMAQACETGLTYLALEFAGIFIIRRRLAL